ncbi:hypothetical protein [Tropicimonas sp. S265A]|uniref:hypothetical protein n=1 Tax=Tropicimonas sp. S265A TaxID=3415134 RepID=UPI003C7B3752
MSKVAEKVFSSEEFVLQLHDKRYDTVSGLMTFFAKSAIGLHGGAIGLVLSGQIFIRPSVSPELWFAVGCFSAGLVCAFSGVGVLYFAMMKILNDTETYANVDSKQTWLAKNIWHVRVAGTGYISSILFFILGLIASFLAFAQAGES